MTPERKPPHGKSNSPTTVSAATFQSLCPMESYSVPSTSMSTLRRKWLDRRNISLLLPIAVLLSLTINPTCNASVSTSSHESNAGRWSHFIENDSSVSGSENIETESIPPTKLALESRLPNTFSRRSRKTEFEFPDGDLILGPVESEEANLKLWRSGPCSCWNTTDDLIRLEIECKCSGSNFTQLHGVATLPQNVHRITIQNAKDFITLGNEDLKPYAEGLSELVLSELPNFKVVKAGTFLGLRNLTTIYIHETPSLERIPDDVFKVFLPKLKLIRLTYTGLQLAPNFRNLKTSGTLHMLEIEHGKISQLQPGNFAGLETDHLSLSYNDLEEIPPLTFKNATIARLNLNGNRHLKTLHPDSFLGIQHLRGLDLSGTSITYLPTEGLKGLEKLTLENVWTLSVIPSIYNFQVLEEASLTWPYHCCAFANPETHDPVAYQAYQEYVWSAVQEQCAKVAFSTSPKTTSASESPSYENLARRSKRRIPRNSQLPLPSLEQRLNDEHKRGRKRRTASLPIKDVPVGWADIDVNEGGWQRDEPTDFLNKHNPESFDTFSFDPEHTFGNVLETYGTHGEGSSWDGTLGLEAEEDDQGTFHHNSVNPSPTVITICGNVSRKKYPKVKCSPIPDAFNPCEDIMGSLWLRGAVWIVVSLALVGNTAVLVVLLLAPGRMSVQRFLMANLSWADLCMGLYLLMVATQDLVSLGSYFNYAIDWQLGWGCRIAGFLTVFASELSVFTLAVITGERWYALTRAIHLTKRLTIVGAAQLMSVGWILSLILAGLPLLGVSSYSKTSICLPMEANSAGSIVYLAFLLLFNGVAFLLVATAYWQMYRAVAGHGHGGAAASVPGASSADTAIAKKMALLVFTDFACWAPVAFFGLTAVGGYPLIRVTDSKILLVFFYPLNSTLNPYLYAIMTKQYRRDLFLLLSRHGICTKRAARYKAGGLSTNNTLQTMQTVLRLGSLTESKVLSTSQRRNSPNGGGTVSAGNDPAVTVELKIGIQPCPNTSPQGSQKGKSQHVPSLGIFDNPLLPDVGNRDRDHRRSKDEDQMNSVNGRHLVETSFISVPITKGESSFQNSQSKGRHVKLIDFKSEENDQDHDVTENTPFCRRESVSP